MGVLQVWPEVRDNNGKWHLIMRDEMGPCPVCQQASHVPKGKCYYCNETNVAPKPFYSQHLTKNVTPMLDWLMSDSMFSDDDGHYPFPFIKGSSVDRPGDLSQDILDVIQWCERCFYAEDGGEEALVNMAPMQSLLDYDWWKITPVKFHMPLGEYINWTGCGKSYVPAFDISPEWGPFYKYIDESEAKSVAGDFSYRVRIKDWDLCPAVWVPGFTDALPLLSSVAPPERTRVIMFYCLG